MTAPDEASALAAALPEPLTFLAVSDLAGLLRGRAMPRQNYEQANGNVSCGWVPANVSLTPFNVIAESNPWGSTGDLRLVPDKEARYRSWPPRASWPLDLVMSEVTELDGSPWACCTRSFLKAALADFRAGTGCAVLASFEQEFRILDPVWVEAPAFSVSALRRAGAFPAELMATLAQAGIAPELVFAEYGEDQFEIPLAPAPALIAADRAAVMREIVREVARGQGWQASFAPKNTPDGVGNGVHIHLSLWDDDGAPRSYDGSEPGGLSALAGSFCAGIVRHLPALVALTAPSPVSALRLKPHNWSASYTWLGQQNREATLRICPVVTAGGKDPARQFNIEYRAADATASPHLALGALIRAGLEGVRAKLPPPPIFNGDPDALSAGERERLGLRRLPQSLPESLAALTSDPIARTWFQPPALETYVGLKQMELKLCEGLDAETLCRRYSQFY